jgi:hypothetical protein
MDVTMVIIDHDMIFEMFMTVPFVLCLCKGMTTGMHNKGENDKMKQTIDELINSVAVLFDEFANGVFQDSTAELLQAVTRVSC